MAVGPNRLAFWIGWSIGAVIVIIFIPVWLKIRSWQLRLRWYFSNPRCFCRHDGINGKRNLVGNFLENEPVSPLDLKIVAKFGEISSVCVPVFFIGSLQLPFEGFLWIIPGLNPCWVWSTVFGSPLTFVSASRPVAVCAIRFCPVWLMGPFTCITRTTLKLRVVILWAIDRGSVVPREA